MKAWTLCVFVSVYECVYLLLVSHGALSSNHNLTAGLCLQLFGCQSTRAQDPPDKVKLRKRKKNTLITKQAKGIDGQIFNLQTQAVFLQCVCVCVCMCDKCAFEVCASAMCLCY